MWDRGHPSQMGLGDERKVDMARMEIAGRERGTFSRPYTT